MKKGLFHIHTHHSFDSMTKPKDIVDLALAEGVDYLVISDHDTTAGSVEARAYAQSISAAIDIPISAEFYTDVGDIIGVGIPEEMECIQCHRTLCSEIKNHGGITVLPHPYDAHRLDSLDFSLIDCIEVFNGKTSAEHNQKSMYLAEYHEKPIIWGCDAHFLKDILLCPYQFEGSTPFTWGAEPLSLGYSPMIHRKISQLIRGVKTKDLMLTLRSIKRLIMR